MTEYLDERSSVTDEGDVVPRDDILDYEPGYVGDELDIFEPETSDLPEADEFVDVPREKARRVISDSLRASIEDWLDLHYHQNPTLEEACARYGVSLEDYEASYVAASEKKAPQALQVTHETLSARSIIEANRTSRLAACATDDERSRLRARFMAEDELRKRP